MEISDTLAKQEDVGVSLSEEDLDRHSRDSWPAFAKWPRRRQGEARPFVVVRPSTVEAVCRVFRVATDAGVSVVPYGGGSGVTGAVVLEQPHVSLDTSRLNEPPEICEKDLVVSVGAGFPSGALEAELNARGYTLGHYPQSLQLASVGGLLATRSSGTFSGWYGSIENLVVGMDAVLPDGQLLHMPPTPRAAVGPNLIELFLGSEGTLGVLVRVWLRICRMPEARLIRGFAFPDVDSGLTAARRALERGLRPAVARIYDPRETRQLEGSYGLSRLGPVLGLFGFDGPSSVVDASQECLTQILMPCGATDLGYQVGETWLEKRFEANWLHQGNRSERHLADAVEVTLPWSSAEATYRKVMRGLQEIADDSWAHFSHLYGQGVGTYFVFQVSGEDPASALDVYQSAWDVVIGAATDGRGAISHHHGVGLVRNRQMAEGNPVAASIMKRVKNAIDPAGIMNPGKLGT